jgi:hypothetical protein
MLHKSESNKYNSHAIQATQNLESDDLCVVIFSLLCC